MIDTTRKSAVLYDFMQVPGGAERVTLALCEYFESMDLVTAFVDPAAFPEPPLHTLRLKTLTSPTSITGWHLLKSARAFERKTDFLKDYDSLIFSGSVAPLAIKNSRAARNIYYCHTPPRFLYDLRDYYLDTATVLQKPVLKALMRYLQPRYEDAIGRMDKVFANSKNVQKRLKKYLNVESEVLYPPCDTEGFEWMGDGDYFLSTARLEPLKRVDLIVEAFKKMPDKKLIVTSGGSQLALLKNIAGGVKNITFTDWVSDTELRGLVGNCIATIYIPKDEDFGISPVQSLAAGKPVIGVNEGGVAETVREPKDGILISTSPSAERVREAVSAIEALKCSQRDPDAVSLNFRQAFLGRLTESLR
jgi:glycosyltransferase involved in cell wall biosynthesis